VISGSVSGVVDCSVLVGCEGFPDVSKGRVASTFSVKQSHDIYIYIYIYIYICVCVYHTQCLSR